MFFHLALLAHAIAAVHGLRVDQLLVSSGICTSRGAAKIAISKGIVTTRQGVVLRKAAANVNEDTVLVLLDESVAGAIAVSEEERAAASRTEACEGPVNNNQADPLAPELPPERKKTSAARAARFRNISPPLGAFGNERSGEVTVNANGLQGRGGKRPATKDGVQSKRYSKKNKRGSTL